MRTTTNIKNILKYTLLLSLPLLLFTFCQNLGEDFIFTEDVKITKDSKIVSLMMEAVKSDANKTFAKSEDDTQCTNLLYPMAFDVFFGDDPEASTVIINSDEELIEFLSTLTANTGFYIHFPLILIDVDGVETVIHDLTEFEGTLQTLIDACQDGDDNDDDNDNNDNTYEFCHSNNKKVYICHKGQTICVSINAIWGHLNQHEEDYLGQCE